MSVDAGSNSDPVNFSPGFCLPTLDDDLTDFLSPARAEWARLGEYAGNDIFLLDLMRNPATNTTKTFASLLIVARAIEYIRQTGESILILSPTSGNKGVALRNAVERAVTAKLVGDEQLRIAIVAPRNSIAKFRNDELARDLRLRRLNPMFVYAGTEPSHVKSLARGFVDRYGELYKQKFKGNIWYSLDLANYQIADATRAFFEHDVSPPSAGAPRRIHAHAVSSAYGLLGYNLGRDLLEARGWTHPKERPSFLLVQHLATADMVLSLRYGNFGREGIPRYTYSQATGLYEQEKDSHFPYRTYDPNEFLDPTFYTRRPPTSQHMNSIISHFGGDGIVVSLHECLERYPVIRRLLHDSSVNLPSDPRLVCEWSLIMALTGVLNVIDRRLICSGQEVVVHGSGSYTLSDFDPLEEAAITPVDSIEDIAGTLMDAT